MTDFVYRPRNSSSLGQAVICSLFLSWASMSTHGRHNLRPLITG